MNIQEAVQSSVMMMIHPYRGQVLKDGKNAWHMLDALALNLCNKLLKLVLFRSHSCSATLSLSVPVVDSHKMLVHKCE